MVTQIVESLRRVVAGYAPPPRLTVSEFSDREVIVTSGPRDGSHWQTDFAPYQRDIMDAHHETGVEIVVVMGSVQWGKTAMLVNKCAYAIRHDPSSVLVVVPTKDMAKEFSQNRLKPVIGASPALKERVGKKRGKDSTNTTFMFSYRGGSVAIVGSNSAASLASRPIRRLMLDEIDKYKRELKGEGNTLSIAIKRTTTFRSRREIFLISSPTTETGPIFGWHKRGDQRRYYVPCPDCGEMQPYEWANVKWTDGDPLTARIHCRACDYAIDDAERVAILSRGEWRAEHPERRDKRIVSFHIWEAYSPLSSLPEIVSGFLAAREQQKAGDDTEMHAWQNTTLGEAYEAKATKTVGTDALYGRREHHPHVGPASTECDVPLAAAAITVGVDTQDDRLEALVVAWGVGEECWVIDRRRLQGDPSEPAVWDKLTREVLENPYRHESGLELFVWSMCIDSAGHRTNYVYDYCAKHSARRAYATIGRGGDRTIVSSPSEKRYGTNERSVELVTIGVDAAKALFLDRLALTEKGAGYIHLPMADWCDEELIKQFGAEKLVKRWTRGVMEERWIKVRPRNEGLDMAVGAIAALRLGKPNLRAMATELALKAAALPKPATPAGQMPPPAPRSRMARSRYLSS